MTEMVTVQNKWEKFVNLVYPHVPKDSDQYAIMQSIYYGGWMDSMGELIDVLNSPDASDEMTKIHKELSDWLKDNADRFCKSKKHMN